MKLQDLFEAIADYTYTEDNHSELIGCPKEVKDFICVGHTHLMSLKNCPVKINGSFNCSVCLRLPSLEGLPTKIGGAFHCSHCPDLKSLKGAPKKINGDFDCTECTDLTNLIGAPQEGVTNFNCAHCYTLKSLEGAPKKIAGNFLCNWNNQLTNLIGAPQEGVVNFYCNTINLGSSRLTSLEGLPPKLHSLNFTDTSIASLDYFEHNVCEIEEISITMAVKTGLLNLLRIKKLKLIDLDDLKDELFTICTILQGYLDAGNITPRTILKARKELIDAGFKDWI